MATTTTTPQQHKEASRKTENFILHFINDKATGYKFKIGLFPPPHDFESPVLMFDSQNQLDLDLQQELKRAIIEVLQIQNMRHVVKCHSALAMINQSAKDVQKEKNQIEFLQLTIEHVKQEASNFLNNNETPF